MPPGHGVGEVEPEPGQKEATGQTRQLVALASGWYSPGAHSEHVAMPRSAANVPGLQVAGSVAPVLQAEPRGQGEHSVAEARPVALLKVPAWQGSGALLPTSQYEPASQSKHTVWPLTFMNLPASHMRQLPCPPLGCTVPGLHAVC